MSTIRKQGILSSAVIYIGFALGALNTILFARWLPLAQSGLLLAMFVSVGNIMYPIATMGMPSFINKFFPYYSANLPREKNDMPAIALVLTLIGFAMVTVLGIVFKPLVIRKFANNSDLFVQYYYWSFVFGLGLSLLYVLEAYAWQLRYSVLTSFLREFVLRLFNTVLILLFFIGVIGKYAVFVKLYSFTCLAVAGILAVVLSSKGKLPLVFSVSRVTKRFLPKIKSLILLTWSGQVVFNLSFYFAAPVIAAVVPGGVASAAVFAFGQNIASFIMAPQRAVAAAAIGPLSQAWRDKDIGRINRIYQRSSLNQLVFAIGMFILIAINFRDGILTFRVKPEYLAAGTVFLIIGLNRVIDMGTGLNTQIIGTSVHWRFDFYTGMILVSLTIPLNYFLAKRYGIIGPAVADIVTFGLYNSIRCFFLYRKYGLQPFDRRTAYALLLGIACYFGAKLIFPIQSGPVWLVLRSAVFLTVYGGAVLALRLSDDALPVWATIKKRIGLGSGGAR
jgi:O-antigen/teichoic acid export membrane protein